MNSYINKIIILLIYMLTYNEYLILLSFFVMFTIRLNYIDLYNISYYSYNLISWNYSVNDYFGTNLLLDDGMVNINTFIILMISLYVGCFYASGLIYLIFYLLAFEFIFILNNNRGKLFLSGLTLIFSYLFGLIINLIINRKKNETGFKDYDEYKSDMLDINEILD